MKLLKKILNQSRTMVFGFVFTPRNGFKQSLKEYRDLTFSGAILSTFQEMGARLKIYWRYINIIRAVKISPLNSKNDFFQQMNEMYVKLPLTRRTLRLTNK